MNIDDYETLQTNSVVTHMTAGAIAGIMEHCVMYPLDSVKTQMQSLSNPKSYSVSETLRRMIKKEGLFRPVRGINAVVFGAGPAHAFYFSSYEFLKNQMLQRVSSSNYNTIIYGSAGVISTLLHDGVMNPAEVVKQRLQMYKSPYKTCTECLIKVYRTEGIGAFYRSYTTQLTMNIPFQSIHFMIYETMQQLTNPEHRYSPTAHMFSGAMAGGVAAAVTTPLDVCKTLLNTSTANTTITQLNKVNGLLDAVKTVYRVGGVTAYFKGLKARVLFQMPATAICWSTYEFFKYILHETQLPPNEPTQQITSTTRVINELSGPLTTAGAALAFYSTTSASSAGTTPGPCLDNMPSKILGNNNLTLTTSVDNGQYRGHVLAHRSGSYPITTT